MQAMVVNELQWTEADYAVAKRNHIKHGTRRTLNVAVVAWGVLENARYLMGILAK